MSYFRFGTRRLRGRQRIAALCPAEAAVLDGQGDARGTNFAEGGGFSSDVFLDCRPLCFEHMGGSGHRGSMNRLLLFLLPSERTQSPL